MGMKKKIVIYGGAFNPPHIGHAIAIDAVMRLFICDEIWLMPSADRKDKTINMSGEYRLNMLKIILAELFPKPAMPVVISTLELERPALTTTHETKLELERKYPDCQFYFLIGSDIVGDIEAKWVNGKNLARSANFIVIKRIDMDLPPKLPPHTTILDDNIVSCDISSTFVRKLIASGHSGLPYTTSGVAKYIAKNKLYN